VRILDLFCGAGGAAMGYHRAFPDAEIIGVDNRPMPRYPFTFVLADAMLVAPSACNFDLVHASPPCQRYSDLAKRNGNAHDWPDYIPALRRIFRRYSTPWVIENVEGAPLRNPVMLCGTMFPGLRVIRHRLFETSFSVGITPPHGKHSLVFTHDKRKAHYGQLDQDTSFVQVTGGGNATVANKGAAMGIDWMTGAELNEAIPPAYTEYIGEQFALTLEAAA
jgi:DNA (cytosine-5)-methyltransferase 1